MATTPVATQGTAQKLEDDPQLPLDSQSNLVYVLTRLFRLIAQVVNPMLAKLAGVNVNSDGNGGISIGPGTDGKSQSLILDYATGGYAQIYSRRNQKIRWVELLGFEGTQNPETGGNAGSPYQLNYYSDDNSVSQAAINISRINGLVTLPAPGGMQINGVNGLNVPNGPFSVGGNLAAANGMGMYWDGATANYCYMGSANPGAWAWQYIRGTHAINWVNGSTSPIFTIDASGNTSVAGNLTCASFGASGTINASGRITGSAVGDVAALYAPSGGIYSDWNSPNALRANVGGISANTTVQANGVITTGTQFTSNGWWGMQINGVNPGDGSYGYCEINWSNPGWNVCHMRSWHQHGVWAGFQFYSDNAGNTIQFVMSNAPGYGSINAQAFNVGSDERGKDLVAPLPPQHDAFMGIVPISWQWPKPPPQKDGDAPMYPDTRDKWGFSAQNLAVHVPVAVNGSVIAEDPDGKPLLATVDTVPISAMTVLEVQALWQRMTALESRVAELEAV